MKKTVLAQAVTAILLASVIVLAATDTFTLSFLNVPSGVTIDGKTVTVYKTDGTKADDGTVSGTSVNVELETSTDFVVYGEFDGAYLVTPITTGATGGTINIDFDDHETITFTISPSDVTGGDIEAEVRVKIGSDWTDPIKIKLDQKWYFDSDLNVTLPEKITVDGKDYVLKEVVVNDEKQSGNSFLLDKDSNYDIEVTYEVASELPSWIVYAVIVVVIAVVAVAGFVYARKKGLIKASVVIENNSWVEPVE